MDVGTEDVKFLFDTIVDSMDFGSGFLDHEDVVRLRRVATLIGVDEKKATPSNFRASFAHDWEPGRTQKRYEPAAGSFYRHGDKVIEEFLICEFCRRRKENPVHHGVSLAEPTLEYEE